MIIYTPDESNLTDLAHKYRTPSLWASVPWVTVTVATEQTNKQWDFTEQHGVPGSEGVDKKDAWLQAGRKDPEFQ